MGKNKKSSSSEQKPQVSRMRTRADVFEHYAPKTGTGEIPVWAQRKEQVALRTKVETTKRLGETPRPVTPKAKENLDKRIIEEIFGNKECYEWYVNKLRESIETMNPDELYKFIKSHPKYAVSSHHRWNSDFARLVNIGKIPPKYRGANLHIQNKRITAAAQRVLVDMWENDVFQLTYGKPKVNPWIYIDGKMGSYTVSVLNDYWVARYANSSSLFPPPPGRSGLNERSYPKKSNNYALWVAALGHLDTQTRNSPLILPPPKETPPGKDFSEIVKAKYAEKDQAGPIPTKDLTIPEDNVIDENMTLAQALGVTYGEHYEAVNPADAPKTNRVMNLTAQQVGAKVEQMKIKKEDRLSLSAQGILSIRKKDDSYRYAPIKIDLKAA